MFMGKTWWIVGASEGLGRALAEALDAAGARLILSARNAQKLSQLVGTLKHARALPMDVTNAKDVEQAARQAQNCDGIIYCAGAYEPMTAQVWDPEISEQIADVNFMGALRVLGHIVPGFCKRDHGNIVLIGSIAGHTGLPGAIGYGASKAALMHLGENIQADLKSTNVSVQIVNPGFIETRLTDKNSFRMPQLMSPERAASHVIRAIRNRRLNTNFPAPFAWLFTLARLLPRRLLLRIM